MPVRKLNPKQQASKEWWEDLLKKMSSKKAASEYTKGSRRAIKPGSMVAFKYKNPKTPLKILGAFDASPLVLIFNIRASYIFGVNLHWTPKPMRQTIIKHVVKMNKSAIKNNRRLELDWSMLKEFLYRTGLAHVVTKQYIGPRMSGVQYIPYDHWKYASELPSEQFVRDKDMSEEELAALIYSHAKKTRQSKNTVQRKK